MGEPRIFILIRNYEDIYPGNFEDFVQHAEVSSFTKEDKELFEQDKEKHLTDAYNFLALQEEEERIYLEG